MIEKAIAAAVLFELCSALLLVLVLAGLLFRNAAVRKARAASAAIRPVIRQGLIEYLAGSSNTSQLREFAQSQRRELAECILELREAVTGETGDRLWELALELAVLHDWCADARSTDSAVRCTAYQRLAHASAYERCRRVTAQLQLTGMDDADPKVRLAAACGLAKSGDAKDLELVFRQAVRSNALGRAVLAEVLRPHAMELAEKAVPRVLWSRQDAHVLAALELIIAWGRAIPLRDLHRLVDGGNRDIRILALRALPLVASSSENQAAVLRAIADEDREISREALAAAGRLRIQTVAAGGDRRTARV
ncbi:MAG: hypothetical protein C5B51_28260 [Terriglobia bacterium]|nr:MAG: hypothetical protein C5B51_28260 [Terriglobia bacterium]